MAHPRDHRERVDAWLARVDVGASASTLVALLQSALDVLWRRAQQTLGDVTVRAIVSRAVVTASSRSPLLGSLEVHAEGVSCAPLARLVARPDGEPTAAAIDAAAVRAAARDVLTELLTVLGDLTANVLTAPLHDALLAVQAVEAGRGEAGEATGLAGKHPQESGPTWDGGAAQRGREDETGGAT